jgi:hypothetical protein
MRDFALGLVKSNHRPPNEHERGVGWRYSRRLVDQAAAGTLRFRHAARSGVAGALIARAAGCLGEPVAPESDALMMVGYSDVFELDSLQLGRHSRASRRSRPSR